MGRIGEMVERRAINALAIKAHEGRRSPHEGKKRHFISGRSYRAGVRRSVAPNLDKCGLFYRLDSGDHHPSETVNALRAATGRLVYTDKVAWLSQLPNLGWESSDVSATHAPTPAVAPIHLKYIPALFPAPALVAMPPSPSTTSPVPTFAAAPTPTPEVPSPAI